MKKIMFNDKFGLTQAVLEGRKTQTRRIIKCPRTFKGKDVRGFYVYKRETDSEIAMGACLYDADGFEIDGGEFLPRYKGGEIVAIAQSYADIDIEPFPFCEAGWRNKMFVKANLMPHQIKITNISIQRLQDISDEDCLAEGISPYFYGDEKEKKYYEIPPNGYSFDGIDCHYPIPREAYAILIDKVSGKGTWESNLWVWVYEFELVK